MAETWKEGLLEILPLHVKAKLELTRLRVEVDALRKENAFLRDQNNKLIGLRARLETGEEL